ncbi:MAG: hypothetical protein J5494_01220 [Candidatus Methanomethylophilaceae archaeon]|nr:hypothetical protein [Candidatus Methanomethylophilaceae archaeon]
MDTDIVLIDIRTCELKISELLAEIERLKSEYPDYEIFMDGDAYAIVGRRKQRWEPEESPSACTTPTIRISGSPTEG